MLIDSCTREVPSIEFVVIMRGPGVERAQRTAGWQKDIANNFQNTPHGKWSADYRLTMTTDARLLERLIDAFTKLGDTSVPDHTEFIPPDLDAGLNEWSVRIWKPAAIDPGLVALDDIYTELPSRFPPLYEQLVLSWRWLEIEIDGLMTLFGNPPAVTIRPLLAKIKADPIVVDVLFLRGLIPFDMASGGSYDPICFDTSARETDGDCPIVRVEHEAVLCNGRTGDIWKVAKSFRSLVEQIVENSDSI